jgi:TonB family protein
MNPSERIRAALLKSEVTRQTPTAPTLERPAEVETTLPLVAASDEDRVALGKSHDVPTKPPKREKGQTVETAPPAVAARKERKASRRTPLIIGVVIVVAGLSAYFQRNLWSPVHTAPMPAATLRPLQVDVETAGAGVIRVQWKTDSAPVTQAREGRLVVTEGSEQPRTMALTPEQLRIGHLDYQSTGDRFDFRLEVVNQSGAVATESVRARVPKPAAAPGEVTPPQTAREQAAPPPKEKAKAEAKADPPPVEKVPDTPQQSRPEPRAFTPPPQQSQRPTEEVRTVLLDPPTAMPSANVVKPVTGLPDRMPSIPAPQGQQSTAGHPPPVGGNLQEPHLMKKFAPTYPALARSLRIEGTVRFTATIRKDGTVQNVQLVSGHKMLIQSASDAVKQWIYRPAVLNGKPVEVTTQIDVKFTLNE